jgi:2-oxoglutarate ferredoxin oxidoreductase subunit beta
MGLPEFPVAMGVIRNVESTTYEAEMARQVKQARKEARIKTMDELLHSGNVFESKG